MPYENSPPPSLSTLLQQRKAVRNINKEHEESLSKMERLALFITNRVGTMGFFLLIFFWTVLWLGWNFLTPKHLQFDPPTAFVFWLFLSNMIQIFLMPLIMIGQNLNSRHSEKRAESDFEVNIKAEQEIETILLHLEYQNRVLMALMEKMEVNVANIQHNTSE